MFDEAVDDFIPTLNFVPDCFVTSKIIKTFFTTFYADENILYFNEDFGNVVFHCNKMCILNIDPNNINLHNNFDEDDLGTIIHVTLLAWYIRFENLKVVKKELNGELMSVA